MIPEVVADVRADVGEGPAWSSREGCLYFVDVSPGAVYRLDAADGRLTRFHIGQEVGAAIPSAEGGLVLAARDGILTCDSDGSHLAVYVPVESDDTSIRMNDAKCDPAGRLWAGTMAFDFRAGAASLYRLDGRVATNVIPDCTIANGLGWSPDGKRMYFIDSSNYRVDVLDYGPETGIPINRRPFVTGSPDTGMPDGLAVDAEGGLWVAFFGSGEVRRFDATGALSQVISFPVAQVTSCCFGGPDLTDLYVTSAAYQLGAAALRDQPLAGATFVVRPGVVGLPTNEFRPSNSRHSRTAETGPR
ncbi:MAG: hypothetical protein JWO57_3440 [Pseudonocardiales bacterium]|nr:hypothetical protein [Pseudonocardiales bacterium]